VPTGSILEFIVRSRTNLFPLRFVRLVLFSFVLLTKKLLYIYIYCIYMYKDRAVPLQAWSGPEGSRKLRFPDYMTTAQDGGKVLSLTHLPPLPPGNAPGTHSF
jgi:hypothetical protein